MTGRHVLPRSAGSLDCSLRPFPQKVECRAMVTVGHPRPIRADAGARGEDRGGGDLVAGGEDHPQDRRHGGMPKPRPIRRWIAERAGKNQSHALPESTYGLVSRSAPAALLQKNKKTYSERTFRESSFRGKSSIRSVMGPKHWKTACSARR